MANEENFGVRKRGQKEGIRIKSTHPKFGEGFKSVHI